MERADDVAHGFYGTANGRVYRPYQPRFEGLLVSGIRIICRHSIRRGANLRFLGKLQDKVPLAAGYGFRHHKLNVYFPVGGDINGLSHGHREPPRFQDEYRGDWGLIQGRKKW
jgi:hypothetical protein